MAKKPKLTVVGDGSSRVAFAGPPGLGKTGANLWQVMTTEYRVSDGAGGETLRQICAAADRAAEYAAVIDAEGPMVGSKMHPREHPLVKHELAARAFVVRGLARLRSQFEPTRRVGRPGYGGIGVTWEQLEGVDR